MFMWLQPIFNQKKQTLGFIPIYISNHFIPFLGQTKSQAIVPIPYLYIRGVSKSTIFEHFSSADLTQSKHVQLWHEKKSCNKNHFVADFK